MLANRDIRAYALSHLGKSLLWSGADALTIFLLVSRAGVAPALAGTLFLAMLLWNALCDLVVGRWHDRRRGSAAPALTLAVIVACLAFPASLLAPRGDIGWILAAGLVFRTAFAVFDVPHNALIADLADTPAQRTRLAQLRALGSAAASIAIGLVAIPMLGAAPSPTLVGGLLCLVALASGLLMIPYLRLAAVRPLPAPKPAGVRAAPLPLPLLPFFLASAVGMVALGAASKAVPHLDLSAAPVAGAALLALMLGRVAAVALAGPLVARLGTRRALLAAYLVLAALLLALPALAGPPLLVWIGLIGVAVGAVAVLCWIRLPDLARAHGADTTAFGAYTMTSKVALGLSGLVLTLAFDHPLAAASGATLAGEALLRLCLIIGAIAAAAAIIDQLPRRRAEYV